MGDLRSKASLRKSTAAAVSDPRLLWHELSLVALLLMEISWVVPWFRSLTATTAQSTTIGVIALLMAFALVALYTCRLLSRFVPSAVLRQVLLLVLLLVSLVAGLVLLVYRDLGLVPHELAQRFVSSISGMFTHLPPELLVMAVVLYAWRRGVTAANTEVVRTKRAGVRFRLSLLAMALFGVTHKEPAITMLMEVIPIYFGAGLLTMALATADNLSLPHAARKSPFTGGWLAGMFAVAAGLTAGGLLAGNALRTTAAFSLVQRFAKAVVTLVTTALAPIVFGLSYAFSRVLDYLTGLFVARTGQPTVREAPEPSEVGVGRVWSDIAAWLEPLRTWMRAHSQLLTVVAVLLAVGLIAWLVVRSSRKQRRQLAQAEDQGESLLSARELVASLRRRLQELRGGWVLGRQWRALQRRLTASAVRQIYGQLLLLSSNRGMRREPAETPLEYLVRLRELFPNHQEEVAAITQAYVHVRYGEYPDDAVDLSLVRKSWDSLRNLPPMIRLEKWDLQEG